jgi:hypothetical protein
MGGEAITSAAIPVPGEKSNHQIDADSAIAGHPEPLG